MLTVHMDVSVVGTECAHGHGSQSLVCLWYTARAIQYINRYHMLDDRDKPIPQCSYSLFVYFKLVYICKYILFYMFCVQRVTW